jgi:hypothetical protein
MITISGQKPVDAKVVGKIDVSKHRKVVEEVWLNLVDSIVVEVDPTSVPHNGESGRVKTSQVVPTKSKDRQVPEAGKSSIWECRDSISVGIKQIE